MPKKKSKKSTYRAGQSYADRAKRGRPFKTVSLPQETWDAIDAAAVRMRGTRTTVLEAAIEALLEKPILPGESEDPHE